MRSVDETFYNSVEWKNTRAIYRTTHPLCEICLAEGRYTPAEIVHHKVWLSKKNINNPKITLGQDNLQSVCKKCHNKIHFKNEKKRYQVLPNGEVVANDIISPL